MAGTIVYKKFETTRIPVTAMAGGVALALAGLIIKVKLEAGPTVVTLGVGTGVQLASGTGKFSFDVTAANLTALGDPGQVTTVISIWNTDMSLVMTGRGVVGVEL